MNQVKNIQSREESNILSQDSNRFETCEKIVDMLVEQGLPKAFNPDNFISKISSKFNLTSNEARTCLKLAISQLDKTEKQEEKEEKRYAQCGYYYPQGYSTSSLADKKDGMDSLSSLGSYNKLMFGIR